VLMCQFYQSRLINLAIPVRPTAALASAGFDGWVKAIQVVSSRTMPAESAVNNAYTPKESGRFGVELISHCELARGDFVDSASLLLPLGRCALCFPYSTQHCNDWLNCGRAVRLEMSPTQWAKYMAGLAVNC
jgi:hypothetical protein